MAWLCRKGQATGGCPRPREATLGRRGGSREPGEATAAAAEACAYSSIRIQKTAPEVSDAERPIRECDRMDQPLCRQGFGDDEMGRSSWFRGQLRQRGERYLLAVPSNTAVRDLAAPLPPSQGRGRQPKAPFGRVDRWCAALPEGAWQTVEVRDGEKGPLLVEAAWGLVQARTEGKVANMSEVLVVFRERPADGKWKHDYLAVRSDLHPLRAGVQFDLHSPLFRLHHRGVAEGAAAVDLVGRSGEHQEVVVRRLAQQGVDIDLVQVEFVLGGCQLAGDDERAQPRGGKAPHTPKVVLSADGRALLPKSGCPRPFSLRFRALRVLRS